MDNPVNYRVRVDLSHFYRDARKLSYIFIDGTKISNVLHLQTKIKNIFGITQSFYLVVNDVFLPVNEDIRIIKDDEVVIVQPGSSGSSEPKSTSPDLEISIPMQNGHEIELKSQKSNDESGDTDLEIFHSSKIDTSSNEVQIIDADIVSQKKRKRVRRKKPKKEKKDDSITLTKNPLHNGFNSTNHQIKKINLEDSKPTRKHLKFNWEEIDESEIKVNKATIIPTPISAKPIVRSSEITSLSTLLNLRNCQQPLSFTGQRRSRTNSETPSISKESSIINGSQEKINIIPVSPNKCPNMFSMEVDSTLDYSKINILDYPIHKDGFEVDDVIAFKILTINENYCPVLSDFIVAKVASKDPENNNYDCKILMGHDQMRTPDGKFALPTDEYESDDKKIGQELVTLNGGHLDQPRLIYRPNTKEN